LNPSLGFAFVKDDLQPITIFIRFALEGGTIGGEFIRQSEKESFWHLVDREAARTWCGQRITYGVAPRFRRLSETPSRRRCPNCFGKL
jgi:hypothetical protein